MENPDFSYTHSLNNYGATIQYQMFQQSLGISLMFSRNNLDSTMNIVRYVSLLEEIEDISTYVSDLTQYSAGLWFRKGIISINGGYSLTKTEGTFPMKMRFPYLTAGIHLPADFSLTFNYRNYHLEQELFQSQEYNAHLYNVGLLFNF